MHTLAARQGQLQRTDSPDAVHPARLAGASRERVLNRQTPRLLQARFEQSQTTSGTDSAKFSHDFSRMSVYAKTPGQLANEARTPAPMEGVDAALRAPGHRLDERMRDFFEARFAHDFSQVRVHTDAGAARSADALNARAFTVGHDVVFGRNEYVPGSESGRFLLAHELAHVIQQRDASASDQSPLQIGDPSDRAEHEADAAAHAALSAPQSRTFTPVSGISPLFTTSISRRVLRRAPKDPDCTDEKNRTWAGCFDTDWYKKTRDADKTEVRYGADIQIRFKPNDKVDADKIAFVQTVQSSIAGEPVSIYFRDAKSDDPTEPDVGPKIRGVARYDYGPKAKETALSRMIDPVEPAAGTAIDSLPKGRTPLAGMTDPDKGSELSKSGPTRYGKFGFRHKGSSDHEDAIVHDPPGLTLAKQVEAHQFFETSALAVAGIQKGAFYGSVQWGWKKSASEDEATLVPFRLLRNATPSPEFAQAAKLWNVSKNTSGEQSIGLPGTVEMFTTSKKTALLEHADKGKSLGNLAANTRVEATDEIDSAHKNWKNVVVISGPLTGSTGWVQQESLSDKPVESKRRSSVRK